MVQTIQSQVLGQMALQCDDWLGRVLSDPVKVLQDLHNLRLDLLWSELDLARVELGTL